MNQIGATPLDVHHGSKGDYEKIGVPNLLAETPGFEESKNTLDKPWIPVFIPPGEEKPVKPSVSSY